MKNGKYWGEYFKKEWNRSLRQRREHAEEQDN